LLRCIPPSVVYWVDQTLGRPIAIRENDGTEKTLVYRKALKVEEQTEKELYTGKIQPYWRHE